MVAIPSPSPGSVEWVNEDLINVTLQDDSIASSLGDPEMRSLCIIIIYISNVIICLGNKLLLLLLLPEVFLVILIGHLCNLTEQDDPSLPVCNIVLTAFTLLWA